MFTFCQIFCLKLRKDFETKDVNTLPVLMHKNHSKPSETFGTTDFIRQVNLNIDTIKSIVKDSSVS